ncbi:hypothetical protein CONCODRAFT_84729, partial [Conidiobolus coronatus NRRL 28638]
MSNVYLIKSYLLKLPQIKNFDRRASLYSKFSNYKELNPSIFEQNVEFWSKIFRDLCELGWLPNNKFNIGFEFNNREFQQLFELEGELPMSFEAVFDELYLKGEIITFESYIMKKNKLLTGEAWTTRLFYGIIESIFGPPEPPNFNSKIIIFKKSAQTLVNIILKYYSENILIYPLTDNLSYYEEFFEDILPEAIKNTPFKNINCLTLNPEAIKLILRGLEEIGVKIQINSDLNQKQKDCYLKFPTSSDINNYLENNSTVLNTPDINELDIKILTLKQSISSHNIQIRKLNHQIDLQTSLAKQSIEKAQNSRAKLQLKKRKQLEFYLNQMESSLTNLTTILFGIRDAHSQTEIYETYKLGLDELNTLSTAADKMKVDDIMDDVSDTITEVNQINQALNELDNTGTLEDEVEAEFNELLKSEESKKQAEKAASQDVDNIINQLGELQINQGLPQTTVNNNERDDEKELTPILN